MRRENHVGETIVLTLHAIEPCDQVCCYALHVRGNDWTDTAESIETFRSCPLRKIAVLKQQIDCGDVIDAGVAKDVITGFVCRYTPSLFSNDDSQFALEHDLARISCGSPDGLMAADDRGRRLDEKQGVLRSRFPDLGGQCMKIVPQRHDLARDARAQQCKCARRKPDAGTSRRAEHVPFVLEHAPALENAESDAVIRTKPRPFRHRYNTDLSSAAISERLRVVLIPHSSMTASFSLAVPLPPEIMAPAWPIRLPGGAVTPAMKPTTGFFM